MMFYRFFLLCSLLLWALPASARSNDAKRGFGVGLGGVGVLGVDVRVPLGEVVEGELGLFYRPGVTDNYDVLHNVASAVQIVGLWGDARFENGFFVLAGTTMFKSFTDRQLGVGWSGRLNLGKRQEHAIDFAVGPGLIVVSDYPSSMTALGDVVPVFFYRATYRRFF